MTTVTQGIETTTKGVKMENKVSIVAMAKEVSKVEDKVLSFSDKQRELLYNFIITFNKADISTKELFCTLLSFYKEGFTKGAIMLEIGKIVNKANQGDELLARLRKLNELANKAYAHKVILKMGVSHFYNIEKSIKLFSALSEQYSNNNPGKKQEALNDVRDSLFKCYDKNDSMTIYNNKVRAKIIELRSKYHLVEVEGNEVVANLKNKVLKLSKEEQKEIFEALKLSLEA